jgi:hypothetical protein
MVRNILDGESRTATGALEQAAANLQNIATQAVAVRNAPAIRNLLRVQADERFSSVGTRRGHEDEDEAEPTQPAFLPVPDEAARRREYHAAREKILSTMKKTQKGVMDDARNEIGTWLPIALRYGYNFTHTCVVDAFIFFLLSVSTSGFLEEREVGGTTIGNSRAEWRGGGFMDMSQMKKQGSG